jgi:hypothetical protein
MSHRVRILLVSAIVLLLGIEVAVRWGRVSKTCVEIVNKGDSLIEDLVVSLEGSQVAVGHVPSGAATHVWLSGAGKGTLTLSFKQAGNPMSGFMVEDFDPRQMRHDGLKMVLQVRPNEVEKYMEDDDTATGMGGLGGRIRQWVSAELAPPR